MGAVTRPGVPRRALELAAQQDALAMSNDLWNELTEVLQRPRLARFIDAAARDAVLDLLRSTSVWFEPQQVICECRDAKDDKILELAIAADASVIVSSDDDLVTMHPWRGIHILRPAAYLQRAGFNR